MNDAIRKALDKAHGDLIYKIVTNAYMDEVQRKNLKTNVLKATDYIKEIEKELEDI
jgi:hypothetical protein